MSARRILPVVALATALALTLVACGGGDDRSVGSGRSRSAGGSTTSTTVAPTAGASLDPHRLPVGDGKVAAAATKGSVFSCLQRFTGGGAFATGSWMNGDGTFDPAKKPSVDGQVSWNGKVSIARSGANRVVTSEGVPSNHTTGLFPIAASDDAFAYDRNPNRITTKSLNLTLPAVPTVATTPSCLTMGAIGIMTTGVVLFNALDDGGRDAVAYEIQDSCSGHPERSGSYHYHSASSCFTDPGTGHSALLGYAFDGFGIYGSRGENGAPLASADLDECHGHTHAISWDGATTTMYHYHLTPDFPYTLGCFRGTPVTVTGAV